MRKIAAMREKEIIGMSTGMGMFTPKLMPELQRNGGERR